ncbi:MAG TPA: dockerin type I domain-containing protein [Ignavibacteria bacterium]
MKIKFFITVVILLSALISLNAQVVFTENFDYTAGDSIGAHGWTTMFGATNRIMVTSPGLTYTGYQLSGIGNAGRLSNNGQDAYKNLTGDSVTSGSLYAAFMVKIDTAKTGDYFFTLGPSSSTTTFDPRVYVKDSAGSLSFGISKGPNAATPSYGANGFLYGTTYLVIVKYKFIGTAAADDELSLYVFTSPSLPMSEPATPYVGPFISSTLDVSNLGRVFLRQGTASNAPSLTIDGIKVGKLWSNIVPISVSPNLIAPVNNSIGNPLNLSLVWSKPQSAIGYNVVLSADTGFTAIILNDSLLTDSVKSLTNLTTLTNYYWKVRAKYTEGWSAFSSAFTFKTIGVPTTVTLSTPANNATDQPIDLTFKWFKAVDQVFNLFPVNSKKGDHVANPDAVTNYWFELSTDSLFTSVVIRDSTLADTTKSVISLSNLTNYWWRVKAKNQIGWAAFSSVWKFTTIVTIPLAPVLTAPANDSTGILLTPAMGWSALAGAVSYRLQVSTDSLFTTTQFDTAGVTGTIITVPVNKLTGFTKYYWRVNATNSGGTGPYSAVWNFTTLQILTLNLKVYLEGFWNGTEQVLDTCKIYLANSTTPFAFVDSATVVLSTSGTAAPVFIKAVNGIYYIVVKHRNHLETWSKLAQSFVTNVAVNYDFTTAATQAFGDNMKQVGSVWVLYGGDANQDGEVSAFDIPIFIFQFGTQGYLSCDFNGDGDVNATDVPIFRNNFGLTKAVPTLFDNPNKGKKNTEENTIKKNNTDVKNNKETKKNK